MLNRQDVIGDGRPVNDSVCSRKKLTLPPRLPLFFSFLDVVDKVKVMLMLVSLLAPHAAAWYARDDPRLLVWCG